MLVEGLGAVDLYALDRADLLDSVFHEVALMRCDRVHADRT